MAAVAFASALCSAVFEEIIRAERFDLARDLTNEQGLLLGFLIMKCREINVTIQPSKIVELWSRRRSSLKKQLPQSSAKGGRPKYQIDQAIRTLNLNNILTLDQFLAYSPPPLSDAQLVQHPSQPVPESPTSPKPIDAPSPVGLPALQDSLSTSDTSALAADPSDLPAPTPAASRPKRRFHIQLKQSQPKKHSRNQ